MALIDLDEAKTAVERKCNKYGCTMLSKDEIFEVLDSVPIYDHCGQIKAKGAEDGGT